MNSVFHPPGKNPFQLPPLPQAHYLPSPSKEIDKSITLTPQKLKHRHEYSLPPEVYTPEQYSIHEDEATSLKPPIPSRVENEDIVRNLQHYLNDVESWTSSQFCEQWPSKDSAVNEDPTLVGSTRASTMPGTRPLTSTARSSKPETMKGKPLRIKTSFATDRNISADSERSSNIQLRLNRFRYGDPKPPEERKRDRTRLPTPSSTPSTRPSSARQESNSKMSQLSSRRASSTPRQDVLQKEQHESVLSRISRISTTCTARGMTSTKPTDSRPKPPIPPNIQDSPEAADTSFSTLNSRLDKLLQESTSVMSSPETRPSFHSSTEKSSSLEFRVSSSNDTAKSSELEMTKLKPQQFLQTIDNEIPRKMLWQKENVPPALPPSPRKVQREDDILYQWRLRRKLEIARDDVEKNTGLSYQRPVPTYTPLRRNEAEKPFANEPPEVLHHSSRIHEAHQPSQVPVYQPQPVPTHPPFQHGPSCNCQFTPHISQPLPKEDSGTSPTPPRLFPTKPKTKSIGVGIVPMVTSETQTGRSLILLNDDAASDTQPKEVLPEPPKRSMSTGSFPHTSTPASSVSFHRVKIVQGELENSPQTSKGSPQARNLSPLSGKTEATTLWSSTDHNKKSEDGRSPVSSVKTSDPKFTSDTETCSPTANVVKEVIGSRLFNTTQTPSSASAISRLKQKKREKHSESEKSVTADDLNGSYTSTERSSVKFSEKSETVDTGSSEIFETVPKKAPPAETVPSTLPVNGDSNNQTQTSVRPVEEIRIETEASEFDPEEMLDKLLEDIANDPGDFADDVVLQTLRSQRDHFLQEFRLVQEQIENLPLSGTSEVDVES